MRSWYVDLVGGVRAWRSDYTCKARAPMQSLGQSPGVIDIADARSAWPERVLIPTWNWEQVRTNTAIKKLRMKDVCFIKKVGFWIGGLVLGHWLQKSSSLTRVNSANVLDEGLRIGGIGRRMNSKVKVNRNKCISKVNLGVQPGWLSIWPAPSPPGPYI
jgi:hypothetical protein